MPYVAPSTVVAGQTYSAANHNIIVNDIIDHEDRLDTVQNAQYPARNVLVNGAMQIAQRGTSVSGITSSGYYTADRWPTILNQSTITNAITADTPDGQGFRNAYRVTCATAVTSLSATTFINVQQKLEGQTLQMIRKGTSNAQPLTLQFWVKSNKTGTYIAGLEDTDNTRIVSLSYTINSADTWEYKTLTFPADTTGTLNNDNGESLDLVFWLGAGLNFTSGSLQTTWAASANANKAVGQTNLCGVANQYWQITGVQLEPGAQASPFEFVRYDDELKRCQRYAQRLGTNGNAYAMFGSGFVDNTTLAFVVVPAFCQMRTTPSGVTVTGSFQVLYGTATGGDAVSTIALNQSSSTSFALDVSTATTYDTDGAACILRALNDTTAALLFTAEL